MPAKFIKSTILPFTIVAIFAWTLSFNLNQYNLQLTGALILLYFASKIFFRSLTSSFFVTTIVLVSIILLLIFTSGGILSPIFFILDFLLIAIALLLSPSQAIVTALTLICLFLWQNYQDLSSSMIINLISLILITPLAIVLSKSYLKNLESQGKISILKEAIKDEQIDNLLWISTTAKPSLSTIINSITDIVMYLNPKEDTGLFPNQLLEKLKTTQKDLISLYTSTGTLEKSIKESSDKMEL